RGGRANRRTVGLELAGPRVRPNRTSERARWLGDNYKQQSMGESVTKFTHRCDGTGAQHGVCWSRMAGGPEPDISTAQNPRALIGAPSAFQRQRPHKRLRKMRLHSAAT